MDGETYRSGLWLHSLDFFGGGRPSYAIVRTLIRFQRGRAIFRDVVELEQRADIETTSFERIMSYSGGDTYIKFSSEACVLYGHRPSPTILVIFKATRSARDSHDTSEPGDYHLLRLDGFVFERVDI